MALPVDFVGVPNISHGTAMGLSLVDFQQCYGTAVGYPYECHSMAMAVPW